VPKDEFEQLERRWRERPLFIEERRRGPIWLMSTLLVALAVLLVFALIDLPHIHQIAGQMTDKGAVTAETEAGTGTSVGLRAAVTSAE
jgi:hypothetical protein